MNTAERAYIQQLVSKHSGGRPALWASGRTSKGDFDGRDWTLEIFDVPAPEQKAVRDALWTLRASLYDARKIALTIILHTPEATTKRYAWVRQQAEPLIDHAVPGVPRFTRPGALARTGLDRRRIGHAAATPETDEFCGSGPAVRS
jgi:hypothetical protein